MAGVARTIWIGARPLHIAIGAGHRNATGGNTFEAELNGRVCQAVLDLALSSYGFDVRSYTPDNGKGIHPGPVAEGPREVAMTWDPAWTVDIFHEVHHQRLPAYPSERGIFVIYPDGTGLDSDYPNPGEVDVDVKEHGPTMARILAGTTGLPVGGPSGAGIMSERQTWVGEGGRRLRVFAATATAYLITHSCRFISEAGYCTNPEDKAIMSQPDFARREAIGILRAYASLATKRMGWSYAYRITGGARCDS